MRPGVFSGTNISFVIELPKGPFLKSPTKVRRVQTQFGGISKEKAVELHNIIKKHDNIKNKYCEKHNIPLIRIPYWELDDIEYVLFDELVKLNVIIEL